MSGHDLIDDYLSELMDDPGKGKPGRGAVPAAPAPRVDQAETAEIDPASSNSAGAEPADGSAGQTATATPDATAGPDSEVDPLAAFREGSATIGDDEFEAMLDALQGQSAEPVQAAAEQAAGDPLAAFREGGAEIGDDEFEAMLDALQGQPSARAAAPASAAAPRPAVGDPLAGFRSGGDEIGDDEFEAMLDALQGQPVPPPGQPAAAAAAGGDPLAAFRDGAEEIGDDEFEAMLDALQGQPASAQVATAAPPASPLAAVPSRAIQALLPPSEPAPAHGEPAAPAERRRRADDRITSWLRFNLARQCFAVEVLKVQEVLRVPHILPVRGTGEATLGVMNLRGQIVPVMDLAIRLGFGATEPNEASRVIVLEERGETLGLLVASVADVLNLSDARMERIGGTPSLLAAEVVRGVSRRENQIIIMLDASKLLN